jgi:hypothetical protein
MGWLFALIRNASFFTYELVMGRDLETGPFGRFLDSL